MRRTLQSMFKVAFRRSLPLQLSTPITFTRSKHKSTLGRSYVLMEDGVEITELPWIVKRLEAAEVPFKNKIDDENLLIRILNNTNGNDNTTSAASKLQIDNVFFRMLQECSSADQVMKLLEMPGDNVTPQVAVIIITLLHSSIQHDLNPLLRPVVFNELCDAISKELQTLPNNLIVPLARCCLNSNLFSKDFLNDVEDVIEARLALCYFSVRQLCSLISTYSESTKADPELIKVLWIHLGNRFGDINEKNISHVFKVLQNLPPDSRYLIKVVDKQLQLCCHKLQADDIASISSDLCLLNYYSSDTFCLFGRWLYANVHHLTASRMTPILGLFNHFNFSDANFQKALEKFVVAFAKRTLRGGNKTTPRTLLRMTADFCSHRRFLCAPILDALATDFAHPGAHEQYDLRDGLTVLKLFGHLSYLPPNSSSFFHAAEQWMELHLNLIGLPDLLELLASFVYIERYPVNFVDRVLNTHTPAVLLELEDTTQRNRASRHLLEIQASYLLEFPTRTFITLVHNNSLNISLTWISGRAYRFQREAAVLMRSLLGHESLNQVHVPRNTSHLINFEFTVDQNKDLLKHSAKVIEATKHAVLLVMPEHVTSKGGLVGEFALKIRHLQILGYATILLHYEEVMWKQRSHSQRLSHLRSILKPFVNLPQ